MTVWLDALLTDKAFSDPSGPWGDVLLDAKTILNQVQSRINGVVKEYNQKKAANAPAIDTQVSVQDEMILVAGTHRLHLRSSSGFRGIESVLSIVGPGAGDAVTGQLTVTVAQVGSYMTAIALTGGIQGGRQQPASTSWDDVVRWLLNDFLTVL